MVRKNAWLMSILFFWITSPTLKAVEATPGELKRATEWIENALTAGEAARLPFSFVYEGKSSGELISTWRSSLTTKPLGSQRTERQLTFIDPRTGLEVRCTATVYQDFPAVAWVLHFKNTGKVDTPILEKVLPLDSTLGETSSGESCKLFHADGSHAIITDFQPRERTVKPGERVELASFGGRPSDGTLPFFNLADGDSNGRFIDIGWTGQWKAMFSREETKPTRVQAGMEAFHARLLPGEEIRTPSILLMFWEGKDRSRAHNLHRRFLREHYTPTVDGKPVDPPIAASPHGVIGFEKTTEENVTALIRKIGAHKVPIDTWWIDAGWYTCADNWARYVGNPSPDPTRFPKGMRPISDAARQAGMKFLLWFESERVMPDSWLYRNHRDWLIGPTADLPAEIKYQYNDKFHLLDLGNPEALAWTIESLSKMIVDSRIDILRNDFNMYPFSYWRTGEPVDRVGIREVRYVIGLYKLFDTLRERHAGLLIDNCASGGRRIDMEMLRRALVLTRSDYLWDPVGQQCHTFGLAQWIPITGIGAASLDAYSCRSGLGSHFTLAANYADDDPKTWRSIGRVIGEAKALKPFFTGGDFYPLGEYSVGENRWMAWQLDLPAQGEGIIQAFRRKEASGVSMTYKLAGLHPKARYKLTNFDDSRSRTIRGEELINKGLTIEIAEKPGAAILRYRRIP